jgi:thiol-disulfide isomerase/thioredoxin
MPSLQALAQQHGSDPLVVLAVNFKEAAPTVERFVQRNAITLPVLLDGQGTAARAWGANVFPTTVLISADGRVKAVVRGALDWAGPQADALVSPLLARSK